MSNNNHIISYQTVYSTQLYLNSSYAQSTLNGSMKSDIVFYFQDVIKIDQKMIEMRLSLVNAQFPISFYQLNNSNNQITITINSNITTYSFPQGNYNVNSFISQWALSVGPGWTITLNSLNNKLSFSYSSNFTFSDYSINSMFSVIGLSNGYICSSNNLILTCSYCVNFLGLTRLLISSPTFNLHNIAACDYGFTKVISSIPINASQGGIINYTNITNFKSIIKNYELSSISIQITDDKENYIDFNNIDWTMTLQIDIVREIIEVIDSIQDIYENATNELLK